MQSETTFLGATKLHTGHCNNMQQFKEFIRIYQSSTHKKRTVLQGLPHFLKNPSSLLKTVDVSIGCCIYYSYQIDNTFKKGL